MPISRMIREFNQSSILACPSHLGFATAKKQMRGFGGLIGVTFASAPEADRFIDGTRFVQAVTSFGGIQTSAEWRTRWGDRVTPGFVRLSAGSEPVEALWAEMRWDWTVSSRRKPSRLKPDNS
jgi:cystathionine gamma-lyase